MANDSYTLNADGSCYVGRFKVPAWIRNQASETWGIVPLAKKWSDVNPDNDPLVNPNYPAAAPWKAAGSFNARATAWNGQTSYGGVIYDPPAGGHNDWAGNDRYKLDLRSDAPSVVRLVNPSGAIGNEITLDDGQEPSGLYSDGQPRSPHNYNAPVYFQPTNKVVLAVLGTGLYKSGSAGTRAAAVFNADTGAFEGLTSEAPSGTGTPSPMASCYDGNRQLIWYRGAGTARFATLNPTTNEWVNRGNQTALSGSISFCYIQDHDVIFVVNGVYGNKFAIFDCSTYQYYQPAISGSFVGMALNGTCQPHYIGGGKLAFWNNDTNTTQINILSFSGDPRVATFTVSQLPVSPSNTVTPTIKVPNGTYGRFQWHPTLGIYTVLNGMSQDLYFYKV